MIEINKSDLYSVGNMNLAKCKDDKFHFLEAGYFHVPEGDHKYYYRYLVNGKVYEMLEWDIQKARKMTQ